jgi:uroporphyrinogen-III synthase
MADKARQVVLTRSPGDSRALARTLIGIGFEPVVLPALALRPEPELDAETLAERLRRLDILIALSPASIRFARRLLPIPPLGAGIRLYAIGAASAAALARWTGRQVTRGGEAHSEGLLAAEGLAEVRGGRIGLLGAPGGRALLAETLRTRGASVELIAVYRRETARWDRRHRERLARLDRPFVLLSSEQALGALLALAGEQAIRLLAGTAVVSSPRLARFAEARGFAAVRRAQGPSPSDFVDALRAAPAAG